MELLYINKLLAHVSFRKLAIIFQLTDTNWDLWHKDIMHSTWKETTVHRKRN